MFQQLLWGARVSLTVAGSVAVLSTLIGLVVGMSAAYFGGIIDDLLSLLTNIILVIPGLPLVIVLAGFLHPGVVSIVIVLTATSWAWGARVIRAQALSLRQKDFVAAAHVIGERPWRVIFFELLPNMWSLVAAYLIGMAIFAIGAEAALEFIGLGDPTTVTWGTMLYWSEKGLALLQGAWWEFLPPGLAIASVAFALSLLNYAIDEATNPLLRASRQLRLVRRRHAALRQGRATPVVRK